MIRITAIIGFSLTLLCPAFCLADWDGECSDHGQSSGGNCEAMSVGAVVAKPVMDATPLNQLLPALEFLLSANFSGFDSCPWVTLVAWNRANTKAPPAAIRQALLQNFLF